MSCHSFNLNSDLVLLSAPKDVGLMRTAVEPAAASEPCPSTDSGTSGE